MRRTVSTIAGLLIAALSAHAASITTETFSAGANGWVGTVAISGSWSFTGGVARVVFDETGFPFPDEATLSNQAAATSGSFTGNYTAAGVELIGFRFQAATALPSDVLLSLRGGTSVFQRSFGLAVAQTGVWYTLAASLANAEQGGWTNHSGSMAEFSAALQDVKAVSVRIIRSGATEQHYLVDELFLDHLPQQAGLSAQGDQLSLQWTALRTETIYSLEGTTNLLTAPWTPLQTFAATNRNQRLQCPGTNAFQFFRLTQ